MPKLKNSKISGKDILLIIIGIFLTLLVQGPIFDLFLGKEVDTVQVHFSASSNLKDIINISELDDLNLSLTHGNWQTSDYIKTSHFLDLQIEKKFLPKKFEFIIFKIIKDSNGRGGTGLLRYYTEESPQLDEPCYIHGTNFENATISCYFSYTVSLQKHTPLKRIGDFNKKGVSIELISPKKTNISYLGVLVGDKETTIPVNDQNKLWTHFGREIHTENTEDTSWRIDLYELDKLDFFNRNLPKPRYLIKVTNS